MSARQTRSGAIFSPWELSQVYYTSVAISSLAAPPCEPAECALELDAVPPDNETSDANGVGRPGPCAMPNDASNSSQRPPIPNLAASGGLEHNYGTEGVETDATGAFVALAAEAADFESANAFAAHCEGPKGLETDNVEGDGGSIVGDEYEEAGLGDRHTTSRTSKRITNATCEGPSLRKDKVKARANAHKHAKRRKQREQEQLATHDAFKRVAKKRAAETHFVVSHAIDANKLPHTQRGYVGLVPRKPEERKALSAQEKVSTLAELVGMGFEYIPWTAESGIGILDGEGRLVVGGGMPKADDWQECVASCAQTIENIRNHCRFSDGHLNHARGPFPAMAHGIAYGRGQPYPMLHSHSIANAKVFDVLLQDPSMRRIAGFQSHLLSCFAPELSQQYKEVLDGIINNQSELKRNFPNSNYATITVNFGPQTVSTPHVDIADLAYGLCAITALGDFNPDLGGHLVLWDLRIVIRFPPGSTLLVPSAVVRHSNLPIQPGERRYSTTQYSTGHLFRYFNNGFRSDKEVQAQLDFDGIASKEYLQSQWEDGLSKLRTFK